jgi:O-antigen/teichoic acid export membrane protein
VFQLAWLTIALGHINQPSRNSYFRSSLIAYLAVMTTIGLVLIAYSRELLTLLTTSEYASGYVVMPWLVGAQIFYGAANITNIGVMISKKTGGNSVAAAVGTAVNISLGLILVANYGIWGAAVGSFIAAVSFTSLLLWFSLRRVNIPFDIRHAVGISIIFVGSSVGVLWLNEYSSDNSAIARTALLALALAIILRTSLVSMRHPVPSLISPRSA